MLFVFGDRGKELFKVFQVARIVRPYNKDDFVEHATISDEVALEGC